MGMKQLLLICALVALVGCGKPSPAVKIANPIIEESVRESLEKPKGTLTKADLAKVKWLRLDKTQITDEGLKEVA